MVDNQKLLYQIALTLLPKVGPVLGKKLVAYCKGTEAIFSEKKHLLEKIPGISNQLAKAITGTDVLLLAEKELEFINKYKIATLFYLDENYPARLKWCNDAPILMYYKGETNFSANKFISVVGTRNATAYGKEVCTQLIKDLAIYHPIIVSGMAYGIDICAHKAALDNKLSTIGILAHGLDRLYPHVHQNIAETMINSNGSLLTEFMSNTNADRENFPKRNRIIAGISDVTVVVEAAKKGGALITAHLANGYNREVFAVPGSIKNTYSEGCNLLIKNHKASLLSDATDIINFLGWKQQEGIFYNKQQKLFENLTNNEQFIIDLLSDKQEVNIDELAVLSKQNASELASTLLNLEFMGHIKMIPGKRYKII